VTPGSKISEILRNATPVPKESSAYRSRRRVKIDNAIQKRDLSLLQATVSERFGTDDSELIAGLRL
jgi:hypothetical protein